MTRAENIKAGIAVRLAPFGLKLSETKTKLYHGAAPWLGHELGSSVNYDKNEGDIDLSEATARRIQAWALAAEDRDILRVLKSLYHFESGSKGPHFRATVDVLERRLGKNIHWPGEDFLDTWKGRLVTPAGKRETRGEGVHGGASDGMDPREGRSTGRASGGGSYCWWRCNASEQHAPDARSSSDADLNENPPCRRRDTRRQGGYRRLDALAEVLRGWGNVLRLADTLRFAHGRPNARTEARILFGSLDKVAQYARMFHLWQQLLAILERTGPLLLTPAQKEALLVRLLRVLRTAATLAVIDSFWFCKYDPLQVLVEAVSTKDMESCRSKLVAERQARERRERPTKKSMYARLLMDHHEESRPTDGWAERAERTRNMFRPDRRNKEHGTAEEVRVAREFGGKPTPRSGAGNAKGDIDTPTARFEVKSTRGDRWPLPMYQLAQLRRTGKMPVVVLAAHQRTEFLMVPETWVDRSDINVVAIRRFEQCPRTLSISRKRCDAAVSGIDTAIKFDLGQHGVWLLGRPDTFAEMVAP